MKLSICIVTYRSLNEIGGCLDSLQRYAPHAKHEIIVVDNASQDGTSGLIRGNYPDITLIRNKKNIGFGPATNLAIRQACGQYVLALNPDTRVEPASLDRLILIADRLPKLGTLAPTLTYPDGAAQPSNYYLPGLWSELRKLIALEKIDERRARKKVIMTVGWSWGAALLFSRKINGELTLFDDHIFLYSEDLELCWRLKKMGRNNYVTGAVTIIHAHNKSAEQFYGLSGNRKRLETFKKTQHYVLAKHQKGFFKPLRFRLFSWLVALNAAWHYLLLKIFGKKYSAARLQTALAEHRLRIKVFLSRS